MTHTLSQPLNGQTKWVVRIVGTGIVAVLGWMAVHDRVSLDQQIEDLRKADRQLTAINTQQGLELARSEERDKRFEENLKDLKDGQKLVLEELRKLRDEKRR